MTGAIGREREGLLIEAFELDHLGAGLSHPAQRLSQQMDGRSGT